MSGRHTCQLSRIGREHTCQLSRIGRETHAITPKKKWKCVSNAWDFWPNFHTFIYTISNKSIAPKPNLTHCITLGLAGLGVKLTQSPQKKKWKYVRFLPQFPPFYIYYHWYINCPKSKSHALSHSWVGRSAWRLLIDENATNMFIYM